MTSSRILYDATFCSFCEWFSVCPPADKPCLPAKRRPPLLLAPGAACAAAPGAALSGRQPPSSLPLTQCQHPAADAQSVAIVLREKQLPYDVRKVDMGSRGADFEELYRSVLPDADTTTKVPVLVDGDHGVSLVESTVIMEYLNQQVGG